MTSNHHKIVYLACPYTDISSEVREKRFHAANRAAADLIRSGHIVFSPITMSHPIDIVLAGRENTLGSEFWVRFDEAFMEFCSEIAILMIDGWESSAGVLRERRFFESRGLPVRYLQPQT
jgi:hypothetical protein